MRVACFCECCEVATAHMLAREPLLDSCNCPTRTARDRCTCFFCVRSTELVAWLAASIELPGEPAEASSSPPVMRSHAPRASMQPVDLHHHAIPAPPEQRGSGCPHGDPTCPCPDGLQCHYEDDPVTGTPAWPCEHCGSGSVTDGGTIPP